MLRGLLRLTWIEIKIFFREPLGAIGTVAVPVLMFIILGKLGNRLGPPRTMTTMNMFKVDVPVFAGILIALNAVLSLVSIIAIYREGGILKRLRATPLRPATILTAHVLVKLLFTAVTLGLLLLAGRRYYPPVTAAPLFHFALALVLSTWSILSMGFLIASLAPTARFAQPLAAAILYPMIGLSGLFVPLSVLPGALQIAARAQPVTYAVSLLQGIWTGEGWWVHRGDVAALLVLFTVCVALSSKLF